MIPDPYLKTGASLARGQSRQDYGTPAAFIQAVEKRFGPITFDLAASEENRKSPFFFGEIRNSLDQPWHRIHGNLWLNPPFSNITPWAKKCAEESAKGARILFLVPSSTGANWFRDYVWGRADIYFLNGRLTFEGCTDPYPKDCLLAHYTGLDRTPDFRIWEWKKDLTYSYIPDTTSPSSPI